MACRVQISAIKEPNIILILADDQAFADLGVTGSEIRTSNIDALTGDGTMLTAIYNCDRCCPTRASLLTGFCPHNLGVGHIVANLGTDRTKWCLSEIMGFFEIDQQDLSPMFRYSDFKAMRRFHDNPACVAPDGSSPEGLDLLRISRAHQPTPKHQTLPVPHSQHHYSPAQLSTVISGFGLRIGSDSVAQNVLVALHLQQLDNRFTRMT